VIDPLMVLPALRELRGVALRSGRPVTISADNLFDAISQLEVQQREIQSLTAMLGSTGQPPSAAPTWSCFNCGTVDDFTVKNEVVDDAGHVLPVIECHVCGDRIGREVDANTPRVGLRPASASAAPAKERARDVHYVLIEQFGLRDTPIANHDIRRILEALAGCHEVRCHCGKHGWEPDCAKIVDIMGFHYLDKPCTGLTKGAE
jgi:hypothetical protein